MTAAVPTGEGKDEGASIDVSIGDESHLADVVAFMTVGLLKFVDVIERLGIFIVTESRAAVRESSLPVSPMLGVCNVVS